MRFIGFEYRHKYRPDECLYVPSNFETLYFVDSMVDHSDKVILRVQDALTSRQAQNMAWAKKSMRHLLEMYVVLLVYVIFQTVDGIEFASEIKDAFVYCL